MRISVSNLDFFAPIVEDREIQSREDSKDDIAKVVDKYVAPMFDVGWTWFGELM